MREATNHLPVLGDRPSPCSSDVNKICAKQQIIYRYLGLRYFLGNHSHNQHSLSAQEMYWPDTPQVHSAPDECGLGHNPFREDHLDRK